MFQAGLGFVGGYIAGSSCASLPCHAQLSVPGRSFKLSVVVHSATLKDVEGGGLIENQRPLIGVSVGDRAKETELGDWSREKGHWHFKEAVTLIVDVNDDLSVYVSTSTRYNLVLANVSLTNRRLGETTLPVPQIVSKFKAEDRDCDGIMYATPVIPFEIVAPGGPVGKIHLSFETATAPPSGKLIDADQCCWAGGEEGSHRLWDEDAASTCAGTLSGGSR